MNAILALRNLPETPDGAEEGQVMTTQTSSISVVSEPSSDTTFLSGDCQ